MISAGRRFRGIMLATLAFVSAGAAVPAQAQDSEARLRKIEAEVRAIQRKVFPGGDGRFFTPETGAAGATAATAAPPATTPMTDMLARLDALEAQIARLTGQVEQNTNSIALLTGRVAALEPPAAAAPAGAAGEPTAPTPMSPSTSSMMPAAMPASTAAPAAPVAAPAPVISSTVAVSPLPPPKPPVPPKPAAAPVKPAGPSAQRLAAVQAILKPATADAADDEYSYGYRLWEAKFYPEAQQQLRLYVDKYPRHPRISYGLNLLGRAYLDDGKPAEAAPWFLKNYQTDKQGARAGDSLLYLAQSMIATGDTRRACIALSEFGDTYPALATGRLLQQYEANRRKVKCN